LPSTPRASSQSLWPLRLLSLAIAVVLWLLYSYGTREQTHTERAFDTVDVTYNIPRGRLVLNPTRVVSVRLSGPESLIRNLSPFQVTASVDVDTATGLQEIVLDESMVTRPAGIDVVSITPARLSLDVDEEIEKDLRVVVDRGGSEPAIGAIWNQEETTAEPPTIRVRGPRRLLENRDRITATIDLEGKIESHVQSVSVDPIHELVQPVGPSIVRISVKMETPGLPGL